MTKEEARSFMVKTVKELMVQHHRRNTDLQYIRGQAVGMIKTFKVMGIITKDEGTDILDELLEMI